MLSAPVNRTPIEYYGWQASASAGGKVWAVYRHPRTKLTYTLHGQLKPELAGLKCTLYQKGEILSDEDMDKLIASKRKGGYSSHRKGADQFADGLSAAGFDIHGSSAKKRSAKKRSAKKRSAKKRSAKKRSAKKRSAKPKTSPRQLVRVKKSIYMYKESGVLKPAWDHIYQNDDITYVIRRQGKESDSPIVKRKICTKKQWETADKKKKKATPKKRSSPKRSAKKTAKQEHR